MVILHKIPEKGRVNRGSKSAICESVVVKEQRVDGSWYKRVGAFLYLRFNNLTDFERNHQSHNPFLANNKQIVNIIHRGDVPLFLTIYK